MSIKMIGEGCGSLFNKSTENDYVIPKDLTIKSDLLTSLTIQSENMFYTLPASRQITQSSSLRERILIL